MQFHIGNVVYIIKNNKFFILFKFRIYIIYYTITFWKLFNLIYIKMIDK
jgi:hypothetical protein